MQGFFIKKSAEALFLLLVAKYCPDEIAKLAYLLFAGQIFNPGCCCKNCHNTVY